MPFRIDEDISKSVAEDDIAFTTADNVDLVTEDFIRRLLAKNRRDRLDLEDIKAHPYFIGM